MEIWKDVQGYEGRYQVSNIGNVKSLQRWDCLNGRSHTREKVLKQSYNRKGYAKVKLYNGVDKKSVSVHRLVAMAFIPNPDNKPQVNHINGNKTDNSVENLEWSTNGENQHHARITGLMDNSKKRGKPIVQYDLQGNVINEWKNIKTASKALGILSSGIIECCKGVLKTSGGYMWKYKGAIGNG